MFHVKHLAPGAHLGQRGDGLGGSRRRVTGGGSRHAEGEAGRPGGAEQAPPGHRTLEGVSAMVVQPILAFLLTVT